MASPLQTQGGIILLWLFILSSGVSSYRDDCWSLMCLTDSSLNCTCKPELPNWLLPTLCLIPLVIIFSCCIRVCVHYYNERDNILRQSGPSLSSPSQHFMPDMIAIQNFDCRTPPSYDEAVRKQQQRYSPPRDDPPAYEDIAMHSISPADVSIPPAFMPNSNNTSNV